MTLAACAVLALLPFSNVHSQVPARKLRVGTYDSRAIAVAFAASKYNPVAEKMKEHEKAKAAGDTKRVRELEAWGEKQQRALHRQGFGRVPVDDLLEQVKDKLPIVAAKSGVVAVTMYCNYSSPDVELVDLTNELVALFDPTEKTLAIVKDLRQHEPVDLDEIDSGREH
jgi:hypothetical protein